MSDFSFFYLPDITYLKVQTLELECHGLNYSTDTVYIILGILSDFYLV